MISKNKISIRLFEIHSLKDKRSIIKSIIHKISHKYRISIAETGDQEVLNFSEITFVLISTKKIHLEQMVHQILDFMTENYNIDILEHIQEIESF